MKRALAVLFLAILAAMLFVTIRASLERSVFDNGFLIRDVWGIATLADAYCGFLTFYAWVYYKERGAIARVAWFLLIMGLGNIAMSAYVLIALFRLPAGAGPAELLLRDGVSSPRSPARA